jgi:hypothetical protein
MSLGVLAIYAFGAFLPWDDLSYFCSAFSVILFLSLLGMPRSPMWLLTKQRTKEAKEALVRLRGSGKSIELVYTLIVFKLHDKI